MDLDALVELGKSNGGLVRTSDLRACSVSSKQTTELVRRGAIARVARGVYGVGGRVVAHDPATIAVSWNVILSFESAAAWYGVELPKPVAQLHVTAPRTRGRWSDRVDGIRLHRAAVARHDIVTVRGVRATSPLRTAIDLARHLSVDDAVAIVDSFMRSGLFTGEEFIERAHRALGPGRMRIQTVASLIDPLSGSILESLTRVLLWRNDLPIPKTQFTFRHPQVGWVGRVDFAWPWLRVILECDGYEFHADRTVFQKDRRRWSSISRVGWYVGVVTWFDVTCDPDYVVALVRDLMAVSAQS